MRKILYILVASLVATTVASCRTATKVVTMHDTLTVERSIVQEVMKHDTVTIDSTKEKIITHTIFDTVGRPYKVTKIEYRDRYITEQGATVTEVVHDTITVQQGSASTEKKTPGRCPWWLWWAIGIALAMMVPALYKYIRK